MGYMNDYSNNRACYISRDARREILSSTHPNRLSIIHNEGEEGRKFDLYNVGFADMVLNKYPSFTEVINTLKDKSKIGQSIAFHRLYCIDRRNRARLIMFKGELLGVFDIKWRLSLEPDKDVSIHKRILSKMGVRFADDYFE